MTTKAGTAGLHEARTNPYKAAAAIAFVRQFQKKMGCRVDGWDGPETQAALTALPQASAPPTGEVAVKALEWIKHPEVNAWRCETIVGLYQVVAIDPAHASWTFDGLPGKGDGGYENAGDEAKAAAQAHFDAAIRSALAHPSPVVGSETVPGWSEAVEALNVTDAELLRIRNACAHTDGPYKIDARFLQKLVDHIRQLRALSPAKE